MANVRVVVVKDRADGGSFVVTTVIMSQGREADPTSISGVAKRTRPLGKAIVLG